MLRMPPEKQELRRDSPVRGGKASTLHNGQSCLRLTRGLATPMPGPGAQQRAERSRRGQAGTRPPGDKGTGLPGNRGQAGAISVYKVAPRVEHPAVVKGQQSVPGRGGVVLATVTVRVLEWGELVFP